MVSRRKMLTMLTSYQIKGRYCFGGGPVKPAVEEVVSHLHHEPAENRKTASLEEALERLKHVCAKRKATTPAALNAVLYGVRTSICSTVTRKLVSALGVNEATAELAVLRHDPFLLTQVEQAGVSVHGNLHFTFRLAAQGYRNVNYRSSYGSVCLCEPDMYGGDEALHKRTAYNMFVHLGKTADLDANGGQPIQNAIATGELRYVRWLLQNGADPLPGFEPAFSTSLAVAKLFIDLDGIQLDKARAYKLLHILMHRNNAEQVIRFVEKHDIGPVYTKELLRHMAQWPTTSRSLKEVYEQLLLHYGVNMLSDEYALLLAEWDNISEFKAIMEQGYDPVHLLDEIARVSIGCRIFNLVLNRGAVLTHQTLVNAAGRGNAGIVKVLMKVLDPSENDNEVFKLAFSKGHDNVCVELFGCKRFQVGDLSSDDIVKAWAYGKAGVGATRALQRKIDLTAAIRAYPVLNDPAITAHAARMGV